MRIALLILMTVIFSVSKGQSDKNSAVIGLQQENPLVFNQEEFGDRFSVLVFTDDNYDYYAINLAKLKDWFERVYFMNLTYKDSRVVNLDSDISKDQTWFKSYYKFKEDEITCLFKDLKDQTANIGNQMTDEEKSAWMAKNDKFKKTNDNE
jgi:hypothetical protein